MNLENSTYKNESNTDIRTGTKSNRATKKSAKGLLISSSVSALILAMSSYVGAQSIPDECTPTNPSAGQSIECIVDSMLSGAADRAGLYIISPPDSTDLTITATAPISGGTEGISVNHEGTGAVTITATDVSGDQFAGVLARNTASGTDITVITTGDVTGGFQGIFADNAGTGSTRVSAHNASGAANEGIFARNMNPSSGDVDVTATGTVSGHLTGVFAANYGTGQTSVDVADVTSASSQGIFVTNGSQAGNISVRASGDVAAVNDGISVTNNGTAAADINAHNITSSAGAGVRANNFGTSTDLTVTTTGIVSGQTDGVYARNFGSGDTFVSVNDATGAEDVGLRAFNASGAQDLTVVATGTVTGASVGLLAINEGSGDTTVTANTATGGTNDGIFAYNAGSAGNLTVSASGDSRGVHGVQLINNGTGATAVSVNNAIGTDWNGILLSNGASSTDATVIASGTVTGTNSDGISVFNAGTGAINVSANNASSAQASGIGIGNTVSGTDINVTASGDVDGHFNGIFIINEGTGETTVSAHNASSSVDDAIFVENRDNGTDITVTGTGTFDGNREGLLVRNFGTGETHIDVTNVSGGGFGILAEVRGATGSDINVTASGDVSGGVADGILVSNQGIGSTTIQAHTVSSENGAAISVDNQASTIGASVTATGDVEGESFGVFVVNAGSGETTVSAVNATAALDDAVFVENRETGTDITVTGTGTFTGGREGLLVQNNGTGTTDVNIDSAIGGNFGVLLQAAPTTQDVNFTSTGSIQGEVEAGILLSNFGLGDTTVSVNDVTSTNNTAIILDQSASAGALSITSTGTIHGALEGIVAIQNAANVLLINAVDIIADQFSGINARNTEIGTDIDITTTGDVTGNAVGIFSTNNGTGSTTINANTIQSDIYSGIVAYNRGASTDLTITTTGDVSGGFSGIYANNEGVGSTTITANNTTGATYSGIAVYNRADTQDLTITSTGTALGNEGIFASNGGSGETVISANNATGLTQSGIFAFNADTATDISVSATGLVSSTQSGVNVNNTGTGSINIAVNDVTAGQYGIRLDSSESTTDATVTSIGTITSDDRGISINHHGSGTTSVTTHDVSGATTEGIFVQTFNSVADLTVVSTGTVSGETDGILTIHNGGGATSITANNVTSATGNAIVPVNTDGTDITVTAIGDVAGEQNGIFIINEGTGETTVSAHNTSANIDDAVFVENRDNGTDITVTGTGTFDGNREGLLVRNFGTGETHIDVTNVSGGGFGILAEVRGATGSDINVTASGDVSGGVADGILVSNQGIGSTTIQAHTVSSENGAAISVDNQASTIGASVTATGDVEGESFGVFVVNAGSGETTVSAVNATAALDDAVFVENRETGTDITVTGTGTFTGGREGLLVRNNGTGTTDINIHNASGGNLGTVVEIASTAGEVNFTSTGSIRGEAGAGILLSNFGLGDTTVSVNDVTSTNNAAIVSVQSASAGALSITSTGTIHGALEGITAIQNAANVLLINAVDIIADQFAGINARNTEIGTDIDITTTGDVTGGFQGIFADNAGTGSTRVSAHNASGAANEGIFARNMNPSSGDVDVTATGTVSGHLTGIFAANYGTGQTSVDVADVTSASSQGIVVTNGSQASNISVRASGDVSAEMDGVIVGNSGTGATHIAVHNVQSNSASGVVVSNNEAATDLSVTATGTVMAANTGINAVNSGTGDTIVSAHDLTSTTTNGIFAFNEANAGDLTVITTGDILAQSNGILAQNRGHGDTVVTAVNATGLGRTGISAINSADANNLTITSTGTVTSQGSTALVTQNFGRGNTVITAHNVSSTQADQAGIFVLNGETAGDVSIETTGDVEGVAVGILANNEGTGTTVINVTSGSVTGQDGTAIFASGRTAEINVFDALITGNIRTTDETDLVTLNSGALVSGDVQTHDGEDRVHAVSGSQLTGNIDVGSGNDVVTLEAGTLLGFGEIILGDDDDVLNLFGANEFSFIDGGEGYDIVNSTTLEGENHFANLGTAENQLSVGVEEVNILGAGTLTYSGVALFDTQVNLRGGTLFMNAEAANVNFTTSAGTLLSLTGSANNLDVAGGLEIGAGQDIATGTVNGDFTLQAGGNFFVDISFDGTSDLLNVTGAASINGGNLNVRSLNQGSGFAFGSSTDFIILSALAGVSGAFDSLISSDLPFLTLSLAYNPTNIVLTATRAAAPPPPPPPTPTPTPPTVPDNTGPIVATSDPVIVATNGGDVSVQGGETQEDINNPDGAGINVDASVDDQTTGGNIQIGTDTPLGSVVGSTDGILVITSGDAVIIIVTSDTIIGQLLSGIRALTGGGGVSVNTSANSVVGGTDGLVLGDTETGNLIVSVDDVTGETGSGIRTAAGNGETDIELSSTADVTGEEDAGIDATSTGDDANITIRGNSGTIVGEITGVNAQTQAADITIDNIDAIRGRNGSGIIANTQGGHILVNDVDIIEGGNGDAVTANSRGGNISVQGGDNATSIVSNGGTGLLLNALDSEGVGGDISIGETAQLASISATNDGINAQTGGAGNILVSTSNDITAGLNGIQVDNSGSGTTQVNVLGGTISAQTGAAINVNGAAADVDVDSATLIGGIRLTDLDDRLSLESADITGMINLSAGDDTLNIAGESSFEQLDGGIGLDALIYETQADATTALDFDTNITGFESISQDGDGLITLSGVSDDLQTYDLVNGILVQNADLKNADLTAHEGSMLRLTGALQSLKAAGGLSIGDIGAIAQSNIIGNFVMEQTGQFFIDILGDGASDILNVGGSATLNGGDVVIQSLTAEEDFAESMDYTILSAAGGIMGQFDQVISDDLPFLTLGLSYDATEVVLTASRTVTPSPEPEPEPEPEEPAGEEPEVEVPVSIVPPSPSVAFASVAVTENQASVARVFDAEEQARIAVVNETMLPAERDFDQVIDSLIFSNRRQALGAFDSTSGEIHAAVLSSATDTAKSFTENLRSMTPQEDGVSIWAQGVGSWYDTGRDNNAYAVDNTSKGLTFGLTQKQDDMYIGVGGSLYTVDADRLFVSRAPVESDINHLAVMTGFKTGPVSVDASIGYGWYDFDVSRQIQVGNSVSRQANAAYKGNGIVGSVEGRLNTGIVVGGFDAVPYMSFDHGEINRKGFTENGAGSVNIIADKESYKSTIGSLGVQFEGQMDIGSEWKFSPSVRVGLGQQFSDNSGKLSGRFLGQITDTNFDVSSAVRGDTRMEMGTQLRFDNTETGLGVSLSYRGERATNIERNDVLVGVSYRFK